MISNSAELELLFVTLRQAAPVPVVVALPKTNTKIDTLWGMVSF